MDKRKLAFLIGLAAIGLLLTAYLLVAFVAFVANPNINLDNVIAGFLWVLGPALLAGLGLWIGRDNSTVGGWIEFILGGCGLLFGIYMLLSTFSSWNTLGLVNQLLIVLIIGSGTLLLTSGTLLWTLPHQEKLE